MLCPLSITATQPIICICELKYAEDGRASMMETRSQARCTARKGEEIIYTLFPALLIER